MYVILTKPELKVIPFVPEEALPPASYIVKGVEDLKPLPASILVGIYNLVNKDASIVKFSDRTTAERRTWPVIEELGKVKADAPAKPAKVPQKRGPRNKKQGVIFHFKSMAQREKGITIKEAVAELAALFPQRNAASMERTCRINLRPSYSPGMEWKRSKSKERGTVYHLVEA